MIDKAIAGEHRETYLFTPSFAVGVPKECRQLLRNLLTDVGGLCHALGAVAGVEVARDQGVRVRCP